MQGGEVVGSYRVVGRLAEGPRGPLYLGQHTLTSGPAAIRELAPTLTRDPAAVERCLADARRAAQLRHPGLVGLLDAGTTRDGRVYLIYERLTGETIAERLRRGPLPVDDAQRLVRQVAAALAALHAAGVVHRDLRPSNLFVGPDPDAVGGERVKLLDVGLGRLFEGSGDAAQLGDPRYRSPEQFSGRDEPDGRADLYAVGAVLHEMVSGRPAIGGDGFAEIVGNHINRAPAPLRAVAPGVPAELEAIVLRLLAKPREHRFADATELLAAIRPAPTFPGERDPRAAAPNAASPFETLDGLNPGGGFNPGMSGVVSSASKTLAGAVSGTGPRRREAAAGTIPLEGDRAVPPPVPPPGRGPRRSAPPPPSPAAAPPPSLAPPVAEPERPLYEVRRRGGGERVVVTSEGERPAESARPAPVPVGVARAPYDEPTLMSERPHVVIPPRTSAPASSQAPAPAWSPVAAPAPEASAPWREPPPLDAAEAPSRRWLGAVGIAMAVLGGGIAAYFIATGDDLEEPPPIATAAPSRSPSPSRSRSPSPPAPVPAPAAPRPVAVAASGTAAAAGTATAAAGAADPGSATDPVAADPAPVPAPAPVPDPVPLPDPAPVPDDGTNRRPAALVTLRIDSLPHGAAVIRAADRVRLGETPFVYETEPSARSVELVLRHAGYADEVVTLPGNRSSDRTVSLTRSTGKDRAPSLDE